MKKILVPLAFLILLLASCSKDDGPISNDEIKAEINGAIFQTRSVNVSQQFELEVSGSDGISTIKIFTPKTPVEGSYTFGNSNSQYYAQYLTGSEVYTSTSGTLNINEVELNGNNQVDRFDATFSFSGQSNSTEVVEVTNGTVIFIY